MRPFRLVVGVFWLDEEEWFPFALALETAGATGMGRPLLALPLVASPRGGLEAAFECGW